MPRVWRHRPSSLRTRIHPRRLGGAVVTVAVALWVLGCEIVIISGPEAVQTGQRASYTVRISPSSGGRVDPLVVAAALDIPEGWTLLRTAFVSTRSGTLEKGAAAVVETTSIPSFPATPTPPGFQRILFQQGDIDYNNGESVELKFDVHVGGAAGTHVLQFWAASSQTVAASATKTVTQVNGAGSRATSALDQPSDRGENFFSDQESGQVAAEDVVIASSTGSFFVRRFEAIGLYDIDPAIALFSAAVYQDSGGLPGVQIASYSNLVADRIETGDRIIGFAEEVFTLTLPTPLELPNGVYWISIIDQIVGSDFGWITGKVDPVSGREDSAFTVGGGAWFAPGGVNLGLRMVGSPDLIVYQEPFESASVLPSGLTCGGGGEIQISDSCRWSAFAATSNGVGAWGNAACTNYGTAGHRAGFTTPQIDISACPAGTQAVLQLDYLLDLEEGFVADRGFIEATVDGVRHTLATNRAFFGGAGDVCSPMPDLRGGLINDKRWRHLSVPIGTGSSLVLEIAGETVDEASNSGVGFLVDDAWVRCGPELFVDGFESGDTSAWSATIIVP